MILKKIEEALNAQINAEFWSAYLYLSMSSYFEAQGRKGFAHWFRIQFPEEQAHALTFMAYLHARDARPVLEAIPDVPKDWESPVACFTAVLEHEQKVTSLINDLYALAEAEKDFATRQMPNPPHAPSQPPTSATTSATPEKAQDFRPEVLNTKNVSK